MSYYVLYLADNSVAGPFWSMEKAQQYEKNNRPWYSIWKAKLDVIYIKTTGPIEVILPH